LKHAIGLLARAAENLAAVEFHFWFAFQRFQVTAKVRQTELIGMQINAVSLPSSCICAPYELPQ